MVSYVVDNNPICDTNIIFNFNIIDILNDYIDKNKGKILITDFVKMEIEEKLKFNKKYQYIVDSIKSTNIIVLEKEKVFNEEELKVINANLIQFGLENDTFLNNKLCKDIGEFTCAIYAAYLSLDYVVTNDKKFIERYGDSSAFKDIKFHNMVQALDKTYGRNKRIQILENFHDKKQEFDNTLKMSDILRRMNNKYKLTKKF